MYMYGYDDGDNREPMNGFQFIQLRNCARACTPIPSPEPKLKSNDKSPGYQAKHYLATFPLSPNVNKPHMANQEPVNLFHNWYILSKFKVNVQYRV